MKKTAKFGFTIIELALTITLILILSFVVITNFSFEPSILYVTGSKLISDIRYAQSLAVSDGSRYGVEFVPGSEIYRIYKDTPATLIPDPRNPSSSYVVNYTTAQEHTGVDLVNANIGGGQRLEYDWKGIPYAGSGSALTSDGTITIQNPYATAIIIITPETGRVSFEVEGAGGGGCGGPCSLMVRKE